MQNGVLHIGSLTIDYNKHRVLKDDRDVGLTQTEFRLVALLGRYAGRVITYDMILREIWGPNLKNDNRILRVNMANIRKKMGAKPGENNYILNELGVGYRMNSD
jgi:two-component system KDP operon response regulator KdpE